MKRKTLTPKQRVLKLWPRSRAHKMTETSWFIYALSKPNKIEVEIGTGLTARDAWADAAERLSR